VIQPRHPEYSLSKMTILDEGQSLTSCVRPYSVAPGMKSLLSAGLNARGSRSGSGWGLGVTTPDRGVKEAAAATWEVNVEALGTAKGCGELKAGASTFKLFLLCSSILLADVRIISGSIDIMIDVRYSR